MRGLSKETTDQPSQGTQLRTIMETTVSIERAVSLETPVNPSSHPHCPQSQFHRHLKRIT